MQLGNGDQPWIAGGQFHHLDPGAAGFGAAMQEVVAAALGAPAAAAQPEKLMASAIGSDTAGGRLWR